MASLVGWSSAEVKSRIKFDDNVERGGYETKNI